MFAWFVIASLAQAGPAQAEADWRIAGVGDSVILYVDAASIEREGDTIRFRAARRLREHTIGGPAEVRERIRADCGSRSWEAVRSWPDRDNGRNVNVEERMTTTAIAGTVIGAALDAACSQSFPLGSVADPDRHGSAYHSATGTVRERLAAAAAADRP